MSALSDAILALHGATGANGETLSVIRVFVDSGTDLSASATNGTLVGSPSTTTGPIMNVSGGGSGLTLNGTSQYIDGGSAADLVSAINGNGLTLMVWAKNTGTAGKDILVGFRRSAEEGLYWGVNLYGNGNYAAGYCSALLANAGFSPYLGRSWGGPIGTTHSTGVWQFYGVNAKIAVGSGATSATLKAWLNGVPLTAHDQLSGAGNWAAMSATGTKFAVGGNFDSSSFSADSYFAGSISHFAAIVGEPTQAQWTTIYKAASYVVEGIPVRHAYYNMASSCFQDAVDGTRCTDGDDIAALKDLSGNANHLAPAGSDIPVYLDTSNWGYPCANFDNLYQAETPSTRQAFVKTDATNMLPHHCCIIVVGRFPATTKYQRAFQPLAGIYNNATPGVAQAVLALQSQDTGNNGDDKIVALTGSTGRYVSSHSTMPVCRTMPTLVVAAINVGGDGTIGSLPTPTIFMNRWTGTANGAIGSSTTSTGIRIGGHGADATDLLAQCRIEEVIITTPLPASTAAATMLALAQARVSAARQTLYPTKHVCCVWDSIGCGFGAIYNRNIFAYFPASSHRTTTYTNASLQNASIDGSVVTDMSERGLNTAGKWGDTAAAQNIMLFATGINDTVGGDTGAAMKAEYDAIHDACVSAGTFGSFVVVGMPSQATQPAGADYNTLQAADVGGKVTRFITLRSLTGKLYDSLHPNDAGHYQMYQDVWGQWGAAALGGNRGGGALGGGGLVGIGGI